MGNKKTTKNLMYLLCVVLLIAVALIIYASYENKAQAPTVDDLKVQTETGATQEQNDLADVSAALNQIDSLASDELDQIQDDLDSIDLSDI